MERKFSVLIGIPCGMGLAGKYLSLFASQAVYQLARLPYIGKVDIEIHDSARILLNRNSIARDAICKGYDYILFVDPDMRPDVHLKDSRYPQALGFIHSSMQHIRENPFCVIAAPALSERPEMKVNVFVYDEASVKKFRRMDHTEAYERHQSPRIEQVHAIGTGLMLIDTVIFARLQHPYFDDIYTDDTKTDLAMSQDIYFTSACTAAGIPVFANFYSWAGHCKSDVLSADDLTPARQSAQECSVKELPRGDLFSDAAMQAAGIGR